MTIKFTCPQCGQRIETTGEAIGTIISCPDCKKNIRVGKRAFGSEAPEQKPPQKATENLIHVTRDGQDFGPFEIEAVNGYLQDGFLFPTDLAWYKGLARWILLSHVPGVQLPPIADQPPPTVQETVKPIPPPAVAPFVNQSTDTGRNRPKLPPVPPSAQPDASPRVAQATQPAAAKPIMTLLKWCASVFGVLFMFGFIRACNEGSNRQTEALPPRNEEERQLGQVIEALPAFIEAGQRYNQQEERKRQAARDESFFNQAKRDRQEQEDRAKRADEVNRRLLGQPARNPF